MKITTKLIKELSVEEYPVWLYSVEISTDDEYSAIIDFYEEKNKAKEFIKLLKKL